VASVTTGVAERVIVPRRPARRRAARRYGVVALFLSPWIIGFLAFIVYPMFASLYYSFTNYDLLSAPRFVGLENYTFMFTKDPQFWQAMRNTLWIIAVGLPLEITFAMLTATLLMRPRRGHRVYRTVYFLPTLAPPVAAALAFVFILNPSFGPVNQIL
jgi:multiple sugar transport system permease protein